MVDNQEECDDGDNDNGNGCSFNCTIEFAYQCNQTSSGRSVCTRNQCQDGIVFNPEEECDDGNNMEGDGCNQACTIEVGFNCSTALSGLSVCFSLCSNGIVDSPVEDCDNGLATMSNIDGCNDTTCAILNLWICESTIGESSQCEHVSVDFDTHNNFTTGRVAKYTAANENVFIADPRFLDATMFGDTVGKDWLSNSLSTYCMPFVFI
jgi:cysteine-rich repeat protein